MSTDFVQEAASVLEQQGLPFVIICALSEDKAYRMHNLYENLENTSGFNRISMIMELRSLADHLETKGDTNDQS
jgi:hypothetical protein